MKTVVSPKWSLRIEDVRKAIKNSFVFAAPLLVVVIPSVIGCVPAEWKYAALVLWVLNFIWDLAKKYAGENKYMVK
jgi:hypothetical protein